MQEEALLDMNSLDDRLFSVIKRIKQDDGYINGMFKKILDISSSKNRDGMLKKSLDDTIKEDAELLSLIASSIPSLYTHKTSKSKVYLRAIYNESLDLSVFEDSSNLSAFAASDYVKLEGGSVDAQLIIKSSATSKHYVVDGWLDSSIDQMADFLNDRLTSMKKLLFEAYKNSLFSDSTEDGYYSEASVGGTHASDVLVFGRIGQDSEGPFTEGSITIEGDLAVSSGESSALCSLRDIPGELCLFPGQVVAALGTSDSAHGMKHFYVKKLFQGLPYQPPYASSSQQLRDFVSAYDGKPMKIVTIPSSLASSLSSQSDAKLLSLVETLEKMQPNLVLLMGPIINAKKAYKQRGYHDGDIMMQFKQALQWMAKLAKKLPNSYFIALPHFYDAIHPYPLPQPSYHQIMLSSHASNKASHTRKNASNGGFSGALSDSLLTTALPENLHLASNPVKLRLNEVKLMITSCDPINFISTHSICRPPVKKRRLICQQILQQRSLFPSYPLEYALELPLFEEMEFDEEFFPDIFLFASVEEPFVECVGDRLFVNADPVDQQGNPQALGSCVSILPPSAAPPMKDAADTTGHVPLHLPPRVKVELLIASEEEEGVKKE